MGDKTTRTTSSSRTSSPSLLLTHLVRTVRQHQLFVSHQHLLVAVSGGADSIALALLLYQLAGPWKLTLTVVHCNYRLRGVESDEDESFVRGFCQDRQLPFLIQYPTLLKQRQRSSLQAAARDARYAFMAESAVKIGADRIVVGHTANDQAETILMWMLRGAGMVGLTGMPYARQDGVIRPLLACTRAQVLAYLDTVGQPYRRDSSNDTLQYHRNRIRQQLLPMMTRLGPATIRVLQRQADLLRADEDFLAESTLALMQRLVSQSSGGLQRLNRKEFLTVSVALQRRLVRAMLRAYDAEQRASSLSVVESVRRLLVSGRNGARLRLKQVLVTLDQGVMELKPMSVDLTRAPASSAANNEQLLLLVPSTVYWVPTKQYIQIAAQTLQNPEQEGTPFSAQRVLFDAQKYSEPLVVRSWQPGDRFVPQGMHRQSKKIQDFFTDQKVPRFHRQQIPLLVAPEGILWVVGLRQDERFMVSRATTLWMVASVSYRAL